jgi:hypothetical protein
MYNISTHIIPAASPRVTPNVPVPSPPPHSSKKRTERDLKSLGLELIEQQAQLCEDGYSGVTDERLLWNCVNRYVKKDKKAKVRTKGLTLFLVHGTGFPKEVSLAMPIHMLVIQLRIRYGRPIYVIYLLLVMS